MFSLTSGHSSFSRDMKSGSWWSYSERTQYQYQRTQYNLVNQIVMGPYTTWVMSIDKAQGLNVVKPNLRISSGMHALACLSNWNFLWLKYSWSPNSRVLTVSGSSLAGSWHCSRLQCAVTFFDSWLIFFDFLGYHLQLVSDIVSRYLFVDTPSLWQHSSWAEVGGVTVYQQSPGLVLTALVVVCYHSFSRYRSIF